MKRISKSIFFRIKALKSYFSLKKKLTRLSNRLGLDFSTWLLTFYGRNKGFQFSLAKGLPVDGNEKPIPWFTFPAIDYLSQLNFEDASVFEFGSGNSSFWWASRASKVVSVEHNRDWFHKQDKQKPKNQRLIQGFSQHDYIHGMGSSCFDIIVIDGEYRSHCTQVAVEHLNSGGLIIIDNSDWCDNSCRYLTDLGFTQIDFIGIGPLNKYVWATSIFFKDKIKFNRLHKGKPIISTGSILDNID